MQIKITERPKEIRDKATERVADLINHGMTDAEIDKETMFDIDRLTLIGVIRDLMHKSWEE